MTEFSSVIPFKKSPCCFASPQGSKSVVLQFVNDTVLQNWKQVKQVRYPSLRYQTIKQVGHLVIYTNLMSLVVACVVGGICFGDLAKRRLACVEFQFRFGANKDFGFGRSRNGTSTNFSRGLWLSFLVLCSETARKCLLRRLREDWDQVKRSGEGYRNQVIPHRLAMQATNAKRSRKNAARYARYNDCKRFQF